MIILIANPKGGTGKTMMAHQLAFFFAFKGKKVAVVDLHQKDDSDGIYFPLMRKQRNQKDPYSFHIRSNQTVHGQIHKELGAEFVIMDPPSGDLEEHFHATQIADKILVPVHCGPASYSVTARYLENYIGDPRFGAALLEFPATEDFIEQTRVDLENRLKISTMKEAIPWSHGIEMAMDMLDSLLNMAIFPFSTERERNISKQFLHLVYWLWT